MISYGRQTIDTVDIEAVAGALGSGLITGGPRIGAFEAALAEYTGARYAVACSSGTAALHMAYLAAGVKAGDAVVTSPNTFLATPNAAIYAGATPVFSDIDPATGNIDAGLLGKTLKKSPKARAVVPVHYAGLPADMDAVSAEADRYGLVVIEDACHALGASVLVDGQWRKVGGCHRSLMTVFSFHPVKSITTGEGGAVTTNDKGVYERLRLLRNHGMVRDGLDAPWLYEMTTLGFNYRMTDFQAALGESQLKRLDEFVARRAAIAGMYSEVFAGSGLVKTPAKSKKAISSHHLYPVRVDFNGLGLSRTEFFERMERAGVRPQVHYIPVHLQPYYRSRFGYEPGDFPRAEWFYSEEVSLPIYPLLTDAEVRGAAGAVFSALEGHTDVRTSALGGA